MTTAQIAQEHRQNIGHDYDLAFELADYAEQEAEAEKWEREGRAEMNYTLFGEWEV